jgi:hypothetical protein
MRAPSERTIKRLFALSRNQCAFPTCVGAIIQPSGTPTGKICHIKARNPGGPRYDPLQTNDERYAFENLILLCGVHHDIVDNDPKTFTVELLKEFKEMHERAGNIELSQEDARLALLLMDSYIHVQAEGDSQVMVSSPGGTQVKNVYHRPPKIKVVLERREGVISSAQARQVQQWIETLVENTIGIKREQAFGMWQNRFKNRFKIARYDELAADLFPEAKAWYRQQMAISMRGLKTKAPDAYRNARYGAIKHAMKIMGADKEDYYSKLSVRLKMRKAFSSLTELTNRDLDRAYNMVMRDAGDMR